MQATEHVHTGSIRYCSNADGCAGVGGAFQHHCHVADTGFEAILCTVAVQVFPNKVADFGRFIVTLVKRQVILSIRESSARIVAGAVFCDDQVDRIVDGKVYTGRKAVAVVHVAAGADVGRRSQVTCRIGRNLDVIIAGNKSAEIVQAVICTDCCGGGGISLICIYSDTAGYAVLTQISQLKRNAVDAVGGCFVLNAVGIEVFPNKVAHFCQGQFVIFHLAVECVAVKIKTACTAEAETHIRCAALESSGSRYVETEQLAGYAADRDGGAAAGKIAGVQIFARIKLSVTVEIDPSLKFGRGAQVVGCRYQYTGLVTCNHRFGERNTVFIVISSTNTD